ncbi:MAG TPA: hypothetical protein VM581_04935 [Magnetospirillaceae bacterium]|nr:hypothetical protein [Magnetospirillaceae bacterium]
MAQRLLKTEELPPGHLVKGMRVVSDTGVMQFGFDFGPDPEVDALRDTVRGERVTNDRDFLVALVTGTGSRIRARHWILRTRIREVRAPWWWLPKYKRRFHGLTPWWVPRTRRESFCAMMRLYSLPGLTELTAEFLGTRFTLEQLNHFLASTPLAGEVADKFKVARTQHMRDVGTTADTVRLTRQQLATKALLAILEDPELWVLKYSDAITAAAANGDIQRLYREDQIDDNTLGLLIKLDFLDHNLEATRPPVPTTRHVPVAESNDPPQSNARLFDTAALAKFVGDGSDVTISSGK